jgi:hypothetical protein
MNKDNLRFFRSSDGSPRAEGDGESARVLAAFLESDLQDDTTTTQLLLNRLAGGKDADDHADAFVGNAFAVTLDGDTVTLAGLAEGNTHAAMVDLEAMRLAVADWLAFVSEQNPGETR